jgi:hypothetical protein
MDLAKIPAWWGDQKKSRPNTVHVNSSRALRTQTELLINRQNDYRQSAIRFEQVSNHENMTNEPRYEILPGGRKPPSRDERDKVTTIVDYAKQQDLASVKFQHELSENVEKYSSLCALKQGRLNAERRETQMKTNELFKSKSLAELNRYQSHVNLAKKRINVKPKMKASRSQADIHDYDDPRNPSLKYVSDPTIKTQKALFSLRKKDFLKDMKKCEQIYANHINAEHRLEHRED